MFLGAGWFHAGPPEGWAGQAAWGVASALLLVPFAVSCCHIARTVWDPLLRR